MTAQDQLKGIDVTKNLLHNVRFVEMASVSLLLKGLKKNVTMEIQKIQMVVTHAVLSKLLDAEITELKKENTVTMEMMIIVEVV